MANASFGTRLRLLLSNRGMTLKALSERSGVAYGNVKDLARGHTQQPTYETILRLTRGLGCRFRDWADDGDSETRGLSDGPTPENPEPLRPRTPRAEPTAPSWPEADPCPDD